MLEQYQAIAFSIIISHRLGNEIISITSMTHKMSAKSLTISSVKVEWTWSTNKSHQSWRKSWRCAKPVGGCTCLVDALTCCTHGFVSPMKWMIFTSLLKCLNAGKYEYVAVDAVLYKNGSRFEPSPVDQSEKYWFNNPWSPPSKLPTVSANWMSFPYVSTLGLKTNTPELKMSGQPTSAAADNSSRSNNSSLFWMI